MFGQIIGMTSGIKFTINLRAELSIEYYSATLSTEGVGCFQKVDKHIIVNNRGTYMYSLIWETTGLTVKLHNIERALV